MRQLCLILRVILAVAGGYASSLGTLYPEGMLLRDDKKHKKTRRASQPAFKTDALKTYVDMLIPIQERRIQALPVEEEFVFYDNIQETLMDVAARVFIGLDEKSPEAQRLNYLFSTINEGLVTILPYDLPFLKFRKSMQARQELREFFISNIPKEEALMLKTCSQDIVMHKMKTESTWMILILMGTWHFYYLLHLIPQLAH